VSVILGVLFAIASVGVLIYYIHHVSVSMQANEIVARVSRELFAGIDHLFPEHIGQGQPLVPAVLPSTTFLDTFDREACPVQARADGYVHFLDADKLLELAVDKNVVIRVERVPGHYVVAGRPLILVWPGERASDCHADQVNAAFALGNQRTSGQDIEFAVTQLVEIAIRALSPGVNDPFTTITCVDHLASALSRLATRDMPTPYRYDDKDQLRMIVPAPTFAEVADVALNQIRQYARSSTAVTIRLLEMIAVVLPFTHRACDRESLLTHAEMIVRGARGGLSEAADRQVVEERYQSVVQLCSGRSTGTGNSSDP
jgi:uncharacterized membrane protein